MIFREKLLFRGTDPKVLEKLCRMYGVLRPQLSAAHLSAFISCNKVPPTLVSHTHFKTTVGNCKIKAILKVVIYNLLLRLFNP